MNHFIVFILTTPNDLFCDGILSKTSEYLIYQVRSRVSAQPAPPSIAYT